MRRPQFRYRHKTAYGPHIFHKTGPFRGHHAARTGIDLHLYGCRG